MTTKIVTDRSGNTIKGTELDGHLYGPVPLERLRHVTKMEARPDDLLVVTHPKAGTHWVAEIIKCLQAGTTEVLIQLGAFNMIDHADPSLVDNRPSPRNFITHFHGDVISPDFIAKKCKMIYVLRDPRDVMVSFYNFQKTQPPHLYQGTFDDYFHLFIEGKLAYGSWYQYTRSWEKVIQDNPDNPILVLSFESMKMNPIENVTKIAEFLGYQQYSEEFLRQIVEKCSFESMSRKKINPHPFNIYRKGIVGDWKNWFTDAQSALFNEVFENEMAGTQAHKLYSHTVREKGITM